MEASDVPETRGGRRLRGATIGWLRERLGGEGDALAFAAAVTLHLARPPGQVALPGAELEVARRVAALLEPPLAEDAAERLAADPAMLASFFQNADLLTGPSPGGGDAVALLVMKALEILESPD